MAGILDAEHLAINPAGNVQLFTSSGVFGATTPWYIWNKPRGCVMAYMFVIGAGASGGGGAGNATTPGGGGGGGGAPSACLLVPLMLIPDRLYVQVGVGPVGGATDTDGSNGSISVIAVQPSGTTRDLLLSTGNAPTSGKKGVSAAGGAAGTAGGAASTAAALLHSVGVWSALNGQTGTAGGTAAGTNKTAAQSLAGAGAGGGGSGAGGDEVTIGLMPVLSGGASSGVGNASPGSDGIVLQGNYMPYFAQGGAGGGGSTAGFGGNGGQGAISSGGGGGGGSTTAAQGGTGGRGGDGLVMIVCW